MKSRRLSIGLKLKVKPIIGFLVFVFTPIYVEAVELCSKEGFVVAIDIGHTIKRHGATSSRGIGEFYFNKNVANLLKMNLIQQGFTKTFLINRNGSDISLMDRANIANKKNAKLFISIHHDSVQPQYLSSWTYQGKNNLYCDNFRGFSIFYSKKSDSAERSLAFAHLLGTELLYIRFAPSLHHAEKIRGENRELIDKEKGIYRFDDLVVLAKSEMPSVLLECGIIVNRDEEILLSNPVYQEMLVLSITRAIEKAWNSKWDIVAK